jgi:hypothetical protein
VLCFGASAAIEKNYYSDDYRSLFMLPQSSAQSNADLAFLRDGTQQTNPGNLALDSTSEVSLGYAGFFQNTFSTSTVSYVTTLGKNIGFGISLGYLLNPDIPYTDSLQTEANVPVYDSSRIYYRTESELFFHAGVGRKYPIIPGMELGVGLALNAQRHSLPPYNGYGIGCDAGATVVLPNAGVNIGVLCENITTNYMRWTAGYSEAAYQHIRLGVGWQKELPYIYGRIKIQHKSLDLLANEGINGMADSITKNGDNQDTAISVPTINHFDKHPLYLLLNGTYGVEYTIQDVVSLRLGLPLNGYSGNVSFGAGINLFNKKLKIDFSYLSHDLGRTYHMGMTYLVAR